MSKRKESAVTDGATKKPKQPQKHTRNGTKPRAKKRDAGRRSVVVN